MTRAVTTHCDKDACVYSVSANTSVTVLHGDKNERFRVRPTLPDASLKDEGSTAYLSSFEIVAASIHSSKTNSTGYECALWACMKAYDTSMSDGHLKQNILSIWNETRLEKATNAHLEEYVFVNIPEDMNTLEHSRQSITTRAVGAIRSFMDELTDGWYQDSSGVVNFSSDWAEAMHDALPDMSGWIQRLAVSLSNEFRRNGKTEDRNNIKYEGSATKMASFVKVKWFWMIYPPVCLTVSMYYLFATILAGVRDDVAIWKGDSMPMLFSSIHPDILMLGSGKMDTHKGLDELGRHGIALAKADSGCWTFEPTVGPEERNGRLRRIFKWRD